MIKCLVIDDEPLALQQLASYVEKIPYFTLVAQCHGAVEAREIIDRERVDAIFVDINMPDINGMDFVKQLSAPPIVVFTTAYSEYAVDGYKVDAVDYLLKPFGLDDFKRAATKVKKRYELENNAAAQQPADDDDSIFLKTEHRVIRANIADIRYVEGMSEYLRIHLNGHDKPLVVLLSMKKLEERLTPHNFLRIHKSYIINMRHFLEMNRTRVTLDNQVVLPFGDSYREKLNSYITSKLLGR